MQTGHIILIRFPFAEQVEAKVRPALVVTLTADKYQDIVACAISSVVPDIMGENELLLEAADLNQLRVNSVIKVDRISTFKKEAKIADLGKLTPEQMALFREKFQALIK